MDRNKKALLIVPHPDDEINLAGQFIGVLHKNRYDIFVVYTTNGDYDEKIGNQRIYEAINALRVLGIKDSNVFFLGYSNEWSDSRHLYDKDILEPLVSKSKRYRTSSIDSKPEFCMIKDKVHHLFTRDNFKSDLKSFISALEADVILCPDFDSHLDHRAASLMFEEVMGEILIEKKSYEPLVLKKFLYSGIWKGPKDFYSSPMNETVNTITSNWNGILYRTESPYVDWSKRIQLMPDESTLVPFIIKNPLYKAARMHKSQIAWYQLLRIINADVVYWWRPTSSLLKYAKISVSSGCRKYLTDFKMYDSKRLCDGPDNNYMDYMWAPNENDNCKNIKIRFEKPQNIKVIRIYNDYNVSNRIKKIELKYGEKTSIYVNPNLSEVLWQIDIDLRQIHEIEIRIIDYCGIPGIVELEMYSKELNFFENVPFMKFEKSMTHIKWVNRIIWKLEYAILNIKLFFEYKLKSFLKELT